MPKEDHSSTRSHQSLPQGGGVELSLDELAKGLASGTLSRGKDLRWMGGAFLQRLVMTLTHAPSLLGLSYSMASIPFSGGPSRQAFVHPRGYGPTPLQGAVCEELITLIPNVRLCFAPDGKRLNCEGP
jgi:hypothetical protein